MDPKNNTYRLFILLALVYWNPASFYLLYQDTELYDFKLLHVLFWFVCVAGLIIVFMLRRNRIGNRWKNLFFSFSTAGILFSLIVLVNAACGWIWPARTGWLFEPGSRVRYETCEFNYLASINSLGLRNAEIDIDKKENFRILCVGDSWTFGWGVNIENSWPASLERYLKENGISHVQVINAGKPGMYSRSYKTALRKMIPALKPDLVILGMLQLDDLAQSYEEAHRPVKKDKHSAIEKIWYAAKILFQHSTDHIRRLVKKDDQEISIKPEWSASAGAMIENFSASELARFNLLSDSMKTMFRNAAISPSVLYYYIHFPNRVNTFNNPVGKEVQFAMAEMTKDIASVNSYCASHGAKLLFLNLPTHSFAGHKQPALPGDELDGWYASNNQVDPLYRWVADVNQVPYLELTKLMNDTGDYFFRYDGHPNERGYEKIASLAGQYLLASDLIPKRKQ